MSEIKERMILPDDATARNIFGPADNHLKLLEKELSARFGARGHELYFEGTPADIAFAKAVMEYLLTLANMREITTTDVHYAIALAEKKEAKKEEDRSIAQLKEVFFITARGKRIQAKTLGQLSYLKMIQDKTITFGVGPAGTGKTFLAVVMAVRALKRKEVERIILTRPAVEAGEKLGFLPGDLQEKIDPYLRPLYDALYFTLGQEVAERYLEKGIIELAPLAYMRGRTLDDAFIILDEAQNTTTEQMKMFLTRIGFGSKAVVTGDITQIDLPNARGSGLVQASKILKDIDEIGFSKLEATDVVRHPVVAKIIRAYEAFQTTTGDH